MIANGRGIEDFLTSLIILVIIWEAFLLIVSGFIGKKAHAKLSITNWGPKLVGRVFQSLIRAITNLVGAIFTGFYTAILAPIGRAIRDLWMRIPQRTRNYIEIGGWSLAAIGAIVVAYFKF